MRVGKSMRVHIAGPFEAHQSALLVHLGDETVEASFRLQLLAFETEVSITYCPMLRLTFGF